MKAKLVINFLLLTFLFSCNSNDKGQLKLNEIEYLKMSGFPGGVVSGTALIRPNYLELLDWPFLWQLTEYVMGGGETNFMFLTLAADHILDK